MISLWSIGTHISQCSGICIGFDFDYYWTSAGYISLFFFIISLFLYFRGKYLEKKSETQKNAKKILSMGILSVIIFYAFSPLSYYYTPNFLQNRNWDLSFSIDKYIENIEYYCYSNKNHGIPPVYEWSICDEKGKIYIMSLGNIDYNIEIFKYSKQTNNRSMYANNFWLLKTKNLLKILKIYKDKDIYIYSIIRNRDDLDFLKKIENLTKDPIVLDFLQSVYKNENLKEKIENMEGINQKIFEIFWQ